MRLSADAVSPLARFFLQEDLNFLVTNRIPRRYATLFMGWFSRVESPALARLSIATWSMFAGDLRLDEAKARKFRSLHECFIRELRDGARPVDHDSDVLVSPCDAIVGAHGRVENMRAFQAKGFSYSLSDLLGDEARAVRYSDGYFATLRLKSSFYHRFHAPCDAALERVTYISGDTWNVNPIALARVEELFCKNERAVLDLAPQAPHARDTHLSLVAVAAILVASIKIHGLPQVLDLRYRGPNEIPCPSRFARKGDELGWFESGSTIVVFASGPLAFAPSVREGTFLRMGEPLFHRNHPPEVHA